MDDFTLSNLHESRNEWSARLITILTPLISEGFNSIFQEALELCNNNDESDKYLMTFQNFISRIPKWNENIIESEHQRIIDKSNCNYLGDLLSCVHVIQLKILTCVRAGKNQKNIKIDIPTFSKFLHNIYINVARKLYTNIYIFEMNIKPLQKQKHMREFEIIIQECILTAIRQTMPIEALLKAYLDESIEEEVIEEIIEKPYDVVEETKTLENIDNNYTNSLDTNLPNTNPSTINLDDSLPTIPPVVSSKSNKSISFNDNVESSDNSFSDLNDETIKIHDNENISIDDFITIENNNEPPILDFEELK
tara:strand:+ start:3576 stop:4499 length:924 start_codon:yes stop_codon:yes gene_type:complete